PAPSPETRAALQALHVLLTAPTPGELENLQNEPETEHAPAPVPGVPATCKPLSGIGLETHERIEADARSGAPGSRFEKVSAAEATRRKAAMA
ncbi:MAG: hypothetical protein NZR01_05245, partial [Bryobacteraceae bacterium]|nr:hypothetical protein [Bryobacteraceae bacterium]